MVEFWATWNETNKVNILDEWADDQFDAKVYRLNIELYPKIQSDNDVVIPPSESQKINEIIADSQLTAQECDNVISAVDSLYANVNTLINEVSTLSLIHI